jgi:hypothetical protein
MDTYYFKFSQLPGDLINFLPGIKHVCERDNKKAVIMLGLDIQWQSPWSDTRQQPATLTSKTMSMLKLLLLSQEYIEDVVSWQEVDPTRYKLWIDFFKILRTPNEIQEFHNSHFANICDLDKIYLVPTTLPYGNIHRWPWYCYPDMACNLADPWLFVEPDDLMSNLIVVNRTLRARNKNLSYSFLKPIEKNIVFAGISNEHEKFMDEVGFEMPLFEANNFMDLATLIRSAKLFIGNQSLCFALAEAMKVPRILEVCPELPNVICTGDNAYDAMYQSCFEYYFNELNK